MNESLMWRKYMMWIFAEKKKKWDNDGMKSSILFLKSLKFFAVLRLADQNKYTFFILTEKNNCSDLTAWVFKVLQQGRRQYEILFLFRTFLLRIYSLILITKIGQIGRREPSPVLITELLMLLEPKSKQTLFILKLNGSICKFLYIKRISPQKNYM